MAERSLIMYRDEAYQHEKKCVTNWLQIKGLIFFLLLQKGTNKDVHCKSWNCCVMCAGIFCAI